MEEIIDATELVRSLRLRIALNLFKSLLLGDRHLPGRHQFSAVMNRIELIDDEEAFFTSRRWEDLFGNKPAVIKRGKARLLDELLSKIKSTSDYSIAGSSFVERKFFETLIHGGLVSHMLSGTKSKQVRNVLSKKANEYNPVSLLHLLIDAIEVNTLTEDLCGVYWEEVMGLAAFKILEKLHEYWSPRHGSLFATFDSNVKILWSSLSEDERVQFFKEYPEITPEVIERKSSEVTYPDWYRAGVENDDVAPQHIYKILFAIAADSDFLNLDSFRQWVYSLATSALAMHALAWTDRYNTFVNVTDEYLYWGAFYHLLFNEVEDKIDMYFLNEVMDRWFAEWNQGSLNNFFAAHELFQYDMAEYGVSVQDITRIVDLVESAHPLV